jgi:hypothetical protein
LADCDLTTARKGKTMTKDMTGDSEVERDLRKMKTAPQALTKSRTLPPADLKGSGTPEQMKALFQRVGMNPVADVLRKPQ